MNKNLNKVLNKIMSFVLATITIIIFPINVSIANNTTSNEDNILKVGFPLQAGFHIVDENGNLSGYNYDYLLKLSQYTGWEYEFIIIEEETLNETLIKAMNMLEMGEIDIMGGMNIIDDIHSNIIYSKIPAGYNKNTISVLDTSTSVDPNYYLNNNEFSIAVNAQNVELNKKLSNYLASNNMIPNLIFLDSQIDCINMLYEEKVDAILSKEISENSDLINIANFYSEPFYFAINSGKIEILNILDEALVIAQKDNPYFRDNLKEEYFTNSHSAEIYFTDQDLKNIEEIGTVKVGFLYNTEPFCKYDKSTGEFTGISIDILEEISRILNIDFEYIFFDDKESLQKDLNDGTVQMIATMPNNYEFARVLDIVMSIPYVNSSSVRLTSNGFSSAGNNTIYSHYISEDLNNYIPIEDFQKAIYILKNNNTQYIYANPYIAQYYLQRNNYTDIEMVQINNISSNICFGISKSAHESLAKYINHSILHISQSTVDKAILDNSYVINKWEIREIISKNPMLFMFVVFFITAVIVCMQINKKRALYRIINKDQLTGLLTRYKFIENMKKTMSTAKPNEYTLISVDIDNFQYINESYGYEYGSDILQIFGKQLIDYFGDDSIIAREKDDTFLVLTKNKQLINDTENYLQDISKSISNVLSDKSKVKTSQGVYFINNMEDTIHYMIDCAHSARFLGKKNYDSTIAEYTEDMRFDRENKNDIVTRMEDALINKDFKVFYQAKVSLNEFDIVGSEALVRWIPDDGKIVFPDQFIPLFENNGFIIKLDYYVFEQVCQFISENKNDMKIPKISVNLSSITMLERNLIEKLTGIMKNYNLEYKLIELEITESAIINNFNDVVKKIDNLRRLGFTISMDDFGSGISSLNHLKDIDVDILKIDKEFMNESLYGDKGITIIKNIISMAKELNLKTVAEGVETKQHVELLKDLGCDIAQGYYFSKPIKEDDFIDILYNNKSLPLDLNN